jgi:hypothetical protein
MTKPYKQHQEEGWGVGQLHLAATIMAQFNFFLNICTLSYSTTNQQIYRFITDSVGEFLELSVRIQYPPPPPLAGGWEALTRHKISFMDSDDKIFRCGRLMASHIKSILDLSASQRPYL